MKRSLSCLLVSALIWTCPGLAAYAAAGEIAAPVGASAARTVPALSLPAVPVSAPASLSVPSIGLKTSVPALQAPAARMAPAEAAKAPTAQQALATGARQLENAHGESQSREVLGQVFEASRAGSEDEAAFGSVSAMAAPALTPSEGLYTRQDSRPPAPPSGPKSPAPQGPRGGKFLGLLATLGRVGLAGAAVVLLQSAAVSVLPAVFGLSPVAAVWAVSSGAVLLPAAVYSRYLLSKHDSPRLRKTKWALDLSIGALIGASAVALPAFAAAAASHSLGFAAPLLAVAGLGSVVSTVSGGRLLDLTVSGGVLMALPALLRVAGAGAIGVAPVLGMMALPVMTTISFFLGSIVKAAESGEPFSVPGTLQKMRFPSFTWVMTGVVFALLSGFAPYHPNIAFFLWTALGFVSKGDDKADGTGGKRVKPLSRLMGKLLNADTLFLGLLVFTALTGFHHPATFLVLAFAGERASAWTEALLGRLLPRGPAAPSTAPSSETDVSSWAAGAERRMPNFHHWLKTGILIGTMVAMGFGMGAMVFGMSSLLKNLAVGALMAAIPYFLSDKLVVAMMKAKPTDQAHDPEAFAIMNDLRDRINAKLVKQGKKPIPMPAMVNVPMELPNAFATGRDPYHAVVGVTQGIKTMLLDPENVRQELVALISSVDPASKSYRVFRAAIAGSIAGVTQASKPQEISQALMRATPQQLKALGVRLLRGVLGHEFSHVMDRHMLTGSIAGGISTGIAFASYGAMWGVAHGRSVLTRLKQAVFGRGQAPAASVDEARDPREERAPSNGVKPEVVEPITTGIVLGGIAKLSALLWAPVIVQVTQMAGSRNNEAQADEDGAYLTGDPEALALALGLLMTWKPKQGFLFSFSRLPGLAATAHMFTVNPLQQLQQAGAMPKADAASQWVLGKRDNWMFDLFITHPDTRWRIETLHDISEGMRNRR